MGYDLHITRREDWFDETGPEITRAEWRALVDARPDLSHSDWSDPGVEESMMEIAPGTVWPLWWSRGEVVSKNLPEGGAVRMHVIALALGARLQGDDGEIYGPDGLPVHEARALGLPPRIAALLR